MVQAWLGLGFSRKSVSRSLASPLPARRPHAAAARRQTDRLHAIVTPAIGLLTLALHPAALQRRAACSPGLFSRGPFPLPSLPF